MPLDLNWLYAYPKILNMQSEDDYRRALIKKMADEAIRQQQWQNAVEGLLSSIASNEAQLIENTKELQDYRNWLTNVLNTYPVEDQQSKQTSSPIFDILQKYNLVKTEGEPFTPTDIIKSLNLTQPVPTFIPETITQQPPAITLTQEEANQLLREANDDIQNYVDAISKATQRKARYEGIADILPLLKATTPDEGARLLPNLLPKPAKKEDEWTIHTADAGDNIVMIKLNKTTGKTEMEKIPALSKQQNIKRKLTPTMIKNIYGGDMLRAYFGDKGVPKDIQEIEVTEFPSGKVLITDVVLDKDAVGGSSRETEMAKHISTMNARYLQNISAINANLGNDKAMQIQGEDGDTITIAGDRESKLKALNDLVTGRANTLKAFKLKYPNLRTYIDALDGVMPENQGGQKKLDKDKQKKEKTAQSLIGTLTGKR